jgi:hypothetical protein
MKAIGIIVTATVAILAVIYMAGPSILGWLTGGRF